MNTFENYEEMSSSSNPGMPSTHSQSSSNSKKEIPPEIDKWNSGAALFTFIWGICNGVYWGLIIPVVVIFGVAVGASPLVAIFVIVMYQIYGRKGNKWAWKAKNWDSVEHFLEVQARWKKACKWVMYCFLAVTVIGLICAAIFG